MQAGSCATKEACHIIQYCVRIALILHSQYTFFSVYATVLIWQTTNSYVGHYILVQK